VSAAEPPVVPGRIHGLRQWALDNAKPPHLRAVVHDQPWPQYGVPFAARCVGHSHAAPSAHCSCGIYAWHPRADNAEYVFPSRDWLGSVTGIIEAWGEVEVHHDGFRAQYARPRWLVLPDRADLETRRRMAEVAAAYGAEVITCANSGELEGHCSRLGLGLDRGAVADLLPAAPAEEQPPYRFGTGQAGVARRAGDVLVVMADWLVTAARLVFQAAIALFAWGLMALAVLGSFGVDLSGLLGTPSESPLATADRALRIVDQAVFPTDEGPLYVAVVRNTSRSATAFDVVPVGELRVGDGTVLAEPDPAEEVDVAPSIPPGRSAVVFDRFDGEDPDLPIRRFTVRMHAGAGFRRAPSPRLEIRATRADMSRCLVAAIVQSGRRREAVDVVVVARDGRGRMVWARGDAVAGPLRRGAQRQTLLRVPPNRCLRSVRSVAAYPWWSADELAHPSR